MNFEKHHPQQNLPCSGDNVPTAEICSSLHRTGCRFNNDSTTDPVFHCISGSHPFSDDTLPTESVCRCASAGEHHQLSVHAGWRCVHEQHLLSRHLLHADRGEEVVLGLHRGDDCHHHYPVGHRSNRIARSALFVSVCRGSSSAN